MGQQQLLLLILGAIIVAIAIGVGVAQFGAHSTEANKDGITASLESIAANAYQYKIRPVSLGGGSNTYTNYTIPSGMISDEHGKYAVSSVTATSLVITGTSSINTTWVATCTAGDTGETFMAYSGW